jgi:hypothetical protein
VPESYRIAITPEQATALLRTSKQHEINFQKVLSLARAIEDGRWDEQMSAQQPIKTHRAKGTLQNGHHRLLAIVLTGIPMCMLVQSPFSMPRL